MVEALRWRGINLYALANTRGPRTPSLAALVPESLGRAALAALVSECRAS